MFSTNDKYLCEFWIFLFEKNTNSAHENRWAWNWINIHGCQPNLEMVIYVLKSDFGALYIQFLLGWSRNGCTKLCQVGFGVSNTRVQNQYKYF